MPEIIVKAMGLVMTLCSMVFALVSLWMLGKRTASEKKFGFWTGLTVSLVLHLSGYFVIWMNEPELSTWILYGLQLAFFILYATLQWSFYPDSDLQLVSYVIFFLSLGFVLLGRFQIAHASKQFLIAAVSAVISFFIPPFIDRLERAKFVAKVSGILGLLILILVLAVGTISRGAKLSISVFDISFQPSEIVKLTYVLLIAMMLRKRKDFRRIAFASGVAAVHVLVLVVSRDLGSALIYFAAYVAMIGVASGEPWYPLLAGGAGAVGSVGAYYLFSHVRTRVAVWRDPWSVYTTGGYQVAQSLFAIASGGLFGAGLFLGRPDTVPLVQMDFIFAAIAEELGIIFAGALILICLTCLLRMLQIARKHQLMFYRIIGTGLAATYGTQVILTIGGAMKMIPSTGVTLPFVSYGGSSVLSTFLIFGVLQGMEIMHRKEVHQFEKEKRDLAKTIAKENRRRVIRSSETEKRKSSKTGRAEKR